MSDKYKTKISGKKTPTYYSWSKMIERCTLKSHSAYHRYGGRGIGICERWLSYKNFVDDMGLRPKGMSLDRIDNDRNYEKRNCKWSTNKEQSNNASFNVTLTFNGKSKSVAMWAEEIGVKRKTIYERLKRGWPVELALSNKIYINQYVGRNSA